MENGLIEPPAWELYPPLRFDAEDVCPRVLDQRLLPFVCEYRELADVELAAQAISDMVVRGAPLIGLTAAAAMVMAARCDPRDTALHTAAQQLMATRPTAVNLRWAVDVMLRELRGLPETDRALAAFGCFVRMRRAEFDNCAQIAIHGLKILRSIAPPADRPDRRLNILTHCNAGWLATGAWGTALAPVYRAAQSGMPIHVWVDETRPRNQGARLTAWELARAGIAHTIIVDNCAGHLMQRGMVDVCIVGADRVTRNGDVCNKIGTYQKALAASDNGIPFYAALPLSTIDWQMESGLEDIVIEARDPLEVLETSGSLSDGRLLSVRSAAVGSQALNYAFDITPARLLRGLICEHGVYAAERGDLQRLQVATGVH